MSCWDQEPQKEPEMRESRPSSKINPQCTPSTTRDLHLSLRSMVSLCPCAVFVGIWEKMRTKWGDWGRLPENRVSTAEC